MHSYRGASDAVGHRTKTCLGFLTPRYLLGLQEEPASRSHSSKGVRKEPQHYEELSRYLDGAWEWIRRNPKVRSQGTQ